MDSYSENQLQINALVNRVMRVEGVVQGLPDEQGLAWYRGQLIKDSAG